MLSRGLTDDEVTAYVRETGERYGYSTAKPAVQVEPRPESGRTVVSLEHGIMAGVDADTRFSVAVYRPGEDAPLAEAVSGPSLNPRSAEAIIDLQDVPPEALQFSAYALGPDGEPASETGTTTVRWPERTGFFAPADGVRVLNNMTFELLNEETASGREHQFRNPRDGWVYLAVSAQREDADATSVLLDGKPIDLHRVGGYWETMRDLPESDHRVQLTGVDGPRILIVRSVGELFHDIYGMSGEVERAAGITGAHDWGFLRAHVLDHGNSIVAHTEVFTEGEYQDQLQWWDDRGGEWSQWAHEPEEDILESLRAMP